jgi:hypothetical protein
MIRAGGTFDYVGTVDSVTGFPWTVELKSTRESGHAAVHGQTGPHPHLIIDEAGCRLADDSCDALCRVRLRAGARGLWRLDSELQPNALSRRQRFDLLPHALAARELEGF